MKRLLLVVDYQKDFVDGALGFAGAEKLDGPISAKIAQYRAAGDDVAFTMDTHGPDYLDTQEGRKLPVTHCLRGSDGWQLYGETGQALDRGRDKVLEKLPDKLQEAARLRMDHPEDTLSQLAERCDPPVTKSALNHRLRKLVELGQTHEEGKAGRT